jgi:hypothetical protein
MKFQICRTMDILHHTDVRITIRTDPFREMKFQCLHCCRVVVKRVFTRDQPVRDIAAALRTMAIVSLTHARAEMGVEQMVILRSESTNFFYKTQARV